MTGASREQVVPVASAEFLLWLGTRVWAMLCGAGLLPYPQADSLFNDVRLYDWWAGNILDGHFPVNDPMWQYPPLAAVVFTAGYLLAVNTSGFIALAFIADAVALALLSRAGQRAGTRLPALLWAAVPLLMGPIVLGRFDVFPTVAAIAALVATSPGRRGGWLAVGGLLKVWPVLGLLAVPRRDLARTARGFAAVAAGVTAALLAWWPGAFSFLTEQRARGLQVESVGALPYMLWAAGPGSTAVDYRYGALEVVSGGTGAVSLILTAILLAALATVARWRIQGRLDAVPVPDLMLLLVLTAMVTSRVLSPQYTLWVLGLLAVCAARPAGHLRRVGLLLAVSALCGQAIYPWLYQSYLSGAAVATAVQVVRVATLLWATALCWRAAIDALTPPAPNRPASP